MSAEQVRCDEVRGAEIRGTCPGCDHLVLAHKRVEGGFTCIACTFEQLVARLDSASQDQTDG